MYKITYSYYEKKTNEHIISSVVGDTIKELNYNYLIKLSTHDNVNYTPVTVSYIVETQI